VLVNHIFVAKVLMNYLLYVSTGYRSQPGLLPSTSAESKYVLQGFPFSPVLHSRLCCSPERLGRTSSEQQPGLQRRGLLLSSAPGEGDVGDSRPASRSELCPWAVCARTWQSG